MNSFSAHGEIVDIANGDIFRQTLWISFPCFDRSEQLLGSSIPSVSSEQPLNLPMLLFYPTILEREVEWRFARPCVRGVRAGQLIRHQGRDRFSVPSREEVAPSR